jgi:hypothetical protein
MKQIITLLIIATFSISTAFASIDKAHEFINHSDEIIQVASQDYINILENLEAQEKTQHLLALKSEIYNYELSLLFAEADEDLVEDIRELGDIVSKQIDNCLFIQMDNWLND